MTARQVPRVSSWPQAVVAVAAIVSGAVALIMLFRGGASLDTIGAFVAIVAGLFAGQYGIARRTQQVAQETTDQTQTLAGIEAGVNGVLHTTVSNAVEAGIARAVERYRAEQAIEAGPERP